MIAETELILTPQGCIYHLNLKPENIADSIIVVGDQSRVADISKHFDEIEFQTQNREFVTHTGVYKGKRITALSTGIGTDNIDIVLNELDALANIDLKTREINAKKKSLNIVRIGTSGALQKAIEIDTYVASSHGIGFDGLLNYYDALDTVNENEISEEFIRQTNWQKKLPYPYIVSADVGLLKIVGADYRQGITATAPGFYGPQGRTLRLNPLMPDLNEKLTDFSFQNYKITNFEMETSALYGLSKHMGHRACTVCVIVANRITKTFTKNYHPAMDKLIVQTLDRLTTIG
jgi:uridine phosphorylase